MERKNCFCLVDEKRRYYFAAKSYADMKEWYEKLEIHITSATSKAADRNLNEFILQVQ